MKSETFDYHYDKHHKAYVTKLNQLLEGKPEASKSLVDVIKTSTGGVFNNAAQVLEPHVLLGQLDARWWRRAACR